MGKRKIPSDDGDAMEVNLSAFHASKDFFNLLVEGNPTYYEIRAAWHTTFVSAAEHIGFTGRAARENLWENLVQGNWKRLHLTLEEEAMPSTEWLDELKWEVCYCSDRWSLDRLTRCHWLFRAYQTAWMRENGTTSELRECERGGRHNRVDGWSQRVEVSCGL